MMRVSMLMLCCLGVAYGANNEVGRLAAGMPGADGMLSPAVRREQHRDVGKEHLKRFHDFLENHPYCPTAVRKLGSRFTLNFLRISDDGSEVTRADHYEEQTEFKEVNYQEGTKKVKVFNGKFMRDITGRFDSELVSFEDLKSFSHIEKLRKKGWILHTIQTEEIQIGDDGILF